jgi:hypothetical protein
MDGYIVGLGVVAAALFMWRIGVPLWRSIRDEGLVLPPAGGPDHLGIEGPRRRS